VPQQREAALRDAAGLEELVPQPEALAASLQRVQPLRVAQPELALQESEAQPEVALVWPRAALPRALQRQEALEAELAPRRLPSSA